MQLADTVPLGGMPPEIILGRGAARRAHRGQPLAVARDDCIIGIESGEQRAGNVGGAVPLAKAEERPRPFTKPLHEPGLSQQPKVAGEARLRLAQDLGQVGNRQFSLSE